MGSGRWRNRASSESRCRRTACQRRRGLGFEWLEARELLAVDIKQEISQLLGQGTRSGQVMVPDVTVGSFLSTSLGDVRRSTTSAAQGQGFTGTVGITAASASLFNDPASGQKPPPFTAKVDGFSGTYNLGTQALALQATDLTVTLGQVLTATATNPTFTYDRRPPRPSISVPPALPSRRPPFRTPPPRSRTSTSTRAASAWAASRSPTAGPRRSAGSWRWRSRRSPSRT